MEVRKAKGSTKARTKVVDLLEEVSGQVAGLYGRGRGRGRTNKGKGKGKTKGTSKGKEIRKVDPKERKEAAEVRWPSPIAWSLDIGVVTAPICLSTTWPRRSHENKNLFLQACLLLLRNPQQQCGESFSLVVHLPILHPQLLLPLHVCLRCPWFYFMIRSLLVYQ